MMTPGTAVHSNTTRHKYNVQYNLANNLCMISYGIRLDRAVSSLRLRIDGALKLK